jgi:hypothetical protein
LPKKRRRRRRRRRRSRRSLFNVTVLRKNTCELEGTVTRCEAFASIN